MDNEAEALLGSPSASLKSKLQLPLSCDPPSPQNPAKRRVWVVSLQRLSQYSLGVIKHLLISQYSGLRCYWPHRSLRRQSRACPL